MQRVLDLITGVKEREKGVLGGSQDATQLTECLANIHKVLDARPNIS